MGDKTSIEWTRGDDGSPGATWNPTSGCDRVSPGCDNCYALKMAGRLKRMGQADYQTDGNPATSGPGFGIAEHPHRLGTPLKWKAPRRVFVDSMSDLFHPGVSYEFIARVWATMAACPQHTFQILTKRPARLSLVADAFAGLHDGLWPLPNVWLGTSVESADYLWRVARLRSTPAAVRFLSCEPLLGPLDGLDLDGIGWVIVGGESGPGARPMDPAWVRSIRDRCDTAGVPFFFKQWGSWAPDPPGRMARNRTPHATPLLDGRTHQEFPA